MFWNCLKCTKKYRKKKKQRRKRQIKTIFFLKYTVYDSEKSRFKKIPLSANILLQRYKMDKISSLC